MSDSNKFKDNLDRYDALRNQLCTLQGLRSGHGVSNAAPHSQQIAVRNEADELREEMIKDYVFARSDIHTLRNKLARTEKALAKANNQLNQARMLAMQNKTHFGKAISNLLGEL